MGLVPHPVPATTPELFKVVTLRPQKVKDLGLVDAGVDVTAQLGNFRHLQALVNQGDVIVVPLRDVKDIPVATAAAEVEPEATEEEATAEVEDTEPAAEADAETEEPQAEPDVQTDDGDGNGGTEVHDDGVEYMEDPTGFTVKEVVAYATAHPEHVEMLLEMEAEGKNRTGVIQALTAMVGSD